MDKRERGSNFSENEKQLLISIISKEKKDTWMRVADEFNAENAANGERTASQLEIAYLNFKRKLKKENADDKAEIYKTGGGLPAAPKIDETKAKLLDQLKPQLEPIVSRFDSSATYLMPDCQVADDFDEEGTLLVTDIPIINAEQDPEKPNLMSPVPGTSNINWGKKKNKRTISDIYENISDYTSKKLVKNNLGSKKADIELQILKLKLAREQEMELINQLKLEQEKLKLKQEEEKLKQEEEKLKQEILKTKALEKDCLP